MKKSIYIFVLFGALLLACTGSKKYFKAAERLEKQGLVNEAADYYLVSLQRKPTNVDARIKLKEVGQKHVSNLASDFFRNYNTQQLEASLGSFESLQDFYGKAKALNVELDYPKTYEDDYRKAVEMYCEKNYDKAFDFLHEKKYEDAAIYTAKIKKYNPNYKNTKELDIKANCEPSYQSAVIAIENKNYASAYASLYNIKTRTDQYKDANDLFLLCQNKQGRGFLIFQPSFPNDQAEEAIELTMFGKFSQIGNGTNNLKLLNNSPFQSGANFSDLYNNTNIDLVQAIHKASGADFLYIYDVSNRQEYTSGLTKKPGVAYREIKTKVNDSTYNTEFKPVDYNNVKQSRNFAVDFRYKVINAANGQVINSGFQTLRSQDAVDYNEFLRPFDGNINSLFPSAANSNNVLIRLANNTWRNSFSARSNLKSMEDLKNDVYAQSVNLFRNSLNSMK